MLKDVSKLRDPGAVVSETVSSVHDTGRLCDMFRTLKTDFKKVYDTQLFFRYVVCDLCWATIHAMLEVMNLENIEDYARRIFQYAEMKEEEVDSSKQKVFLASCISH